MFVRGVRTKAARLGGPGRCRARSNPFHGVMTTSKGSIASSLSEETPCVRVTRASFAAPQATTPMTITDLPPRTGLVDTADQEIDNEPA